MNLTLHWGWGLGGGGGAGEGGECACAIFKLQIFLTFPKTVQGTILWVKVVF